MRAIDRHGELADFALANRRTGLISVDQWECESVVVTVIDAAS